MENRNCERDFISPRAAGTDRRCIHGGVHHDECSRDGPHRMGQVDAGRFAFNFTVAESGKNLVLFGDPESNPAIRRINAKLPIRWIGENIVAGEQDSLPENIRWRSSTRIHSTPNTM